MKSNYKLIRAVACGIFLIACDVTVVAGEHDSRILQYKLNRLYFDAGEEANVFVGSRFAIHHADSIVCAGLIESSDRGVSVSEVTDWPPGDLSIDSCRAIIETAEPEPNAVIRLGTDIPLSTVIETSLLGRMEQDTIASALLSRTISDTAFLVCDYRFPWADTVVIVYYQDGLQIGDDFVTGTLDGYLSYRRVDLSGVGKLNVVRAAAPFIAVLLPNLRREVNRIGSLTTSLYYRFDHSRLPLYFPGDGVRPAYSLCPGDESSKREYPFDANKGRELFAHLARRPRRLSIYVDHRELTTMFHYFSDILSRDRCRVERAASLEESQVAIEFITYDATNRYAGLETVLKILADKTLEGSPAAEAVDLSLRQFEWLLSETDTVRQSAYCRQIERRLVRELGVFPLFQPSVFVGFHKHIKGISVLPGGALDLSRMRRVVLPSATAGTVP